MFSNEWRRWLRRTVKSLRGERGSPIRRQPRLGLEVLEDRVTPNANYHNLQANLTTGTSFSQNWDGLAGTSGNAINGNNDWSQIASIIGYAGTGLTPATAGNPGTITAASTPDPETAIVVANQSDVNSSAAGIFDFSVASNPVANLGGNWTIGMKAAGANSPYLILHLNTTDRTNITVNFTLRELSTTAASTPVNYAVQFRTGTVAALTGAFTNAYSTFTAPGGDVTDNTATRRNTPVSVTLPAAADNKAFVQVRIITTDADATVADEWVGVDDIVVTSSSMFKPTVTAPASTNEDTKITTGLFITPNTADLGQTFHYKFTNITNGKLFKFNTSTMVETEITNGMFVPKGEVDQTGELRFLPTPNLNSAITPAPTFKFDVQATKNATGDANLRGDVVTPNMTGFTVNAINDAPSVTLDPGPTVNEDSGAITQPGFVAGFFPAGISPLPAAGAAGSDENSQTPVSYTVTNNNNPLFSVQPAIATNGTLTYTPAANAFGSATVTVIPVDSESGTAPNVNTGQTPHKTFTITVNARPDTPTVSDAFTSSNTPTAPGATTELIVNPSALDGAEVTHFKITNIRDGRVFFNDGVTEILPGTFITLAEGQLGLKFTPATDFVGTAHFDVQSSLSAMDSGLGDGIATANIFVQPTVTLRVSPATITESGGVATVTAELLSASTQNVTVNLAYTGSALGTDYTASDTKIVIIAGNLTGSVTLTGRDDDLIEGDQQIIVDIASVTNAIEMGTQQQTVTITDADSATVEFQSSTPLLIGEDAAIPLNVGVRLVTVGNNTLEAAASFNVTLDSLGTAEGMNADFDDSSFPKLVTFSAGRGNGWTETVTFDPASDNLAEGDETATLGLVQSGVSPVTVTTTGNLSQAVTIQDADVASVSFQSGASSPAEEGGQVTLLAVLSILGGGTLAENSVYSVAATPGTALTSDYTLDTASITFMAGEGDGITRPILVTPLSDNLVEGNEGLSITLTRVSGVPVGATDTHSLTIDDNDSATISIAPVRTITEIGAQTVAVSLVTSNGAGGPATLAPGITLTADVVDLLSGTADSGVDYNVLSTQTVSFGPTSGNGDTRTVTITPIDDVNADPNETINLRLQNLNNTLNGQAALGNTNGVVTIQDNESSEGTVSFELVSSSPAEEGGEVSIIVTLTTAAPSLSAPAVFNVAATPGTASTLDFTLIDNQITFPATSGNGAQQVVRIRPTSDALVEGNESFSITLSVASGAVTIGNTGTHTLVIDDNDTATLSIEPTKTISEEGGAQTVAVTLTTSLEGVVRSTLAPGVTLTANVSDLLNGTATSGVDYAAFSTQSISFGPGNTHGAAQSVTVTTIDDSQFETNETVNLQLQSLNTTLDGQASLGNTGSIVTITSAEGPPIVSLSLSANPISERGGQAVLTATLDRISTQAVAIAFGFGGTATIGTDYSASSSTISIPAGSRTGSLTITALNDQTAEPNETIVINVAATNAGGVIPSSVTTTITDNTSSPANTPSTTSVVAQGGGGEGRINIYDANGGLVYSIIPFIGFAGEVHVATGDVSGDGIADILVGTGPGASGHVKAFDGASGSLLRSFIAFEGFLGGISVAVGDINADGFADMIVGSAGGTVSHVKVYSGRDQSLMRSFLAFDADFIGGVTVAGGDVNADGFADIIVGSGAGALPHVKVFSGRDQGLLQSFLVLGPAGGATFGLPGGDVNSMRGISLAAGDVNGDRYADIIVGSSSNSAVRVYSGATNQLIHNFSAFPGFAGGVVVGATDRDGDGRADIIVGTGAGSTPHVKIFKGLSLDLLASYFAFDPTFSGGVFVG